MTLTIDHLQVLVQLMIALGGIGGGAAGLWARNQSHKQQANAELIDDLREETRRIREVLGAQDRQIASLRGEVASLNTGVQLLSGQIRGLGHDPVWPASDFGAPSA